MQTCRHLQSIRISGSNRLLKNPHAVQYVVKNRFKMLMYWRVPALSHRFLPCLALA